MLDFKKNAIAAGVALAAVVSAIGANDKSVSFDVIASCVAFEDASGRMVGLSSSDGRPVAYEFINIYPVLSSAGDKEGRETEDQTVSSSVNARERQYRCVNPKLPGLEIVKTYRPCNGGVRRTVEFRRTDSVTNTVYVQLSTECRFHPDFKKDAWHFGTGYMGPIKPFPQDGQTRPGNEYRQSSKGLVFTHPVGNAGSFAHFRTCINGTTVFPWWHSTIGHYREYGDRLWYTKDGYRMCLGTLDVRPGKPASYTDQFTFFDGNFQSFFDKVFATDPDFAAELRSLPPPPAWLQDIGAIISQHYEDNIRFFAEMLDDCEFLGTSSPCGDWADYDLNDGGIAGYDGGYITRDELKAFMDRMKRVSPRFHPDIYHITISAGARTAVRRRHPEWFRTYDREGTVDSLFPAQADNFQSMYVFPELRTWLVDTLMDFERQMGGDTCYIDEYQMTNTIDWERDRVTTDADAAKFMRQFKLRCHKEGLLAFANGSANPYADLNFYENPHEIEPKRWRDWAGIGWTQSMMNSLFGSMRRSAPLYWTAKADYANRILALGWVPAPMVYTGFPYVHYVRATHQLGNMWPIDVRYTPDWRADAKTQIESYSMVRVGTKDVLISFINRGNEADVPVSVDLGTLGYAPDTRINIWKQRPDLEIAQNGPHFSNAELRRFWREDGAIRGATLYAPELVYSGCATGILGQVLSRLGTDRMEQLFVTASPASLFAYDDLPLNFYVTTRKGSRVSGDKVHLDRKADILLADKDHVFTDVKADGRNVPVRSVNIGGCAHALVTLEAGDWALSYSKVPRRSGEPLPALPSPGVSVRQTLVRPVSTTFMYPASNAIVTVGRKIGDVTLLRKAEMTTKCEQNYYLQTNIPPAIAKADDRNLVLAAGTTRRQAVTRRLEAFAGFEFSGLKKAKLRFAHTFNDAFTIRLKHTYPWGAGDSSQHFAGIVVDYRVNGKYVKRVNLFTGLFHPKSVVVNPATWGKGAKPDSCRELGNWIEEKPERTFALDFAEFAPEGWDGTLFLSLGEARLQPGRMMTLEMLSLNDTEGAEVLHPMEFANLRDCPAPVNSKPLKTAPKSMKEILPDEWTAWTKLPGRFSKTREGRAKYDTKVYLSHDYQYLYFGVVAEDDRGAVIGQRSVVQNDHMEYVIVRPDGAVFQLVADARGLLNLYVDNKAASVPAKTVCRASRIRGGSWYQFVAIPMEALKLDLQKRSATVRANVCRVRRGLHGEFTSWAPVGNKGFTSKDEAGELVLDFNW